ncbi:hypothetical protein RhiirC2_804051, partial [Rhizophagus irregularis]
GFDLKISFKPISDPFNLKGQFSLVYLLSFDNQLLNSLACQQIYFLSQLVTEDGLFLLSWIDLRSLLLVSLKGPTPGWFKALIGLVTLPSSYALRPEFYIQDDLLPNFSVPLIAHEYGTSSSKKLWIATTSCRIGKHALDAPPDEHSIRSSDLVIGRSLRIAPDTSLVLSHWLYTNEDSSSLTPRSSKLILRPCPGCQHNTTSIKRS